MSNHATQQTIIAKGIERSLIIKHKMQHQRDYLNGTMGPWESQMFLLAAAIATTLVSSREWSMIQRMIRV